jgi:hypothetical protein
MGEKVPDGSTVLEDFKTFSSFFQAHKDPVTGLLDIVFVGRAICRILNKYWNGDNFRYLIGNGVVYVDSGKFNFLFVGSVHTLSLRAYIDTEQTGRQGSVYKVDVHVEQISSPGLCLTCARWCGCDDA